MRNAIWTLLVVPLVSWGCDRETEREVRTGAPRHAELTAAKAAPDKDTNLSARSKPFVIDLGGIKAGRAEGCALTVSFGSIGTGTDTAAKVQIERLLEQDPAVAEIQPFVIGREGETLLCIRLRRDAEADRLFDALSAAASNGYMVTIKTRSGREFRSSRKRL